MSCALPTEIRASLSFGAGNRVYSGTSMRAIAAFTDRASGAAVEVSGAAFVVRSPDGAEFPAQADVVSKLGTGLYAIALAAGLPGTWTVAASCILPSHAIAVRAFDAVALPGSPPPTEVEYMTTPDGLFIYTLTDGTPVVRPAPAP